MRQQVVASLALAVVALCASRVAANDFWLRVQVLDCLGQPATGDLYVSLYGCTDSTVKDANGGTPPAALPQNSVSIGKVNSEGYAAYIDPGSQSPVGIPDEGEFMTCELTRDSDLDVGLKTDYCNGSAEKSCSLAVMTRTGSAADGYTYSVNTAYEPVTGLYTSTADTVTVPSSGLSYLGLKGFVRATYANYECPSRKAYCTSVATAVVIRPKATSCPPTCATCPVGPANPTGLLPQCVSGETGYAYMCANYDGTGTISKSYPSFISFRSNQKLFPSSTPLDLAGNNWGWMAYWPTTYVTNAPASCGSVNGYIFAGQDSPAGTVSASVTKSATQYTLNYSINLGAGNKLQTVHVYFSCSILTRPAPGQFGNKVNFNPVVSSYSGTAYTTSLCAQADGKDAEFLYLAIHVAIAA